MPVLVRSSQLGLFPGRLPHGVLLSRACDDLTGRMLAKECLPWPNFQDFLTIRDRHSHVPGTRPGSSGDPMCVLKTEAGGTGTNITKCQVEAWSSLSGRVGIGMQVWESGGLTVTLCGPCNEPTLST